MDTKVSPSAEVISWIYLKGLQHKDSASPVRQPLFNIPG